MESSTPPDAWTPQPNRLRIGAVVAAAVAVGFLVWLLLIRGDDDGGGRKRAAQEVTPADLVATAGDLGHSIYWVGPKSGSKLELKTEAGGNVFVRYLTGGAEVGDPNQSYLTIGTYPFTDAYHALQVVADRPGSTVKQTPDGGLVVTNENSATSVYVAYPGQDLEIEVYDPDPATALDLATSGAVQPVG